MKNYFTFPFKTFSLVILCSLFFVVSNAQRRLGQVGQNNQRERSQPANQPQVRHMGQPRPPQSDQRPQRNNDRDPRQSQSYPDRGNHIGSHIQTAPRREPAQRPSPRFNHPDRNFRNDHVRVDVRPGYTYYGGSYRRYYRSPVYNAHNPCWRYNYLPARRAVITAFPFEYQTINYGGYGYRYYNGCYYQPYNNAFIVVAPPLGLFINTLPFGYRRIYVHDNPYYYYNGTYYDEYEDNYRVVAPPVGAVVESIPQGYETMTVDGETYYKVDGVQYKPAVQDNGEIWYEVIKVD